MCHNEVYTQTQQLLCQSITEAKDISPIHTDYNSQYYILNAILQPLHMIRAVHVVLLPSQIRPHQDSYEAVAALLGD